MSPSNTVQPTKIAIDDTGLSYAQGCMMPAPERWLFISGQTPENAAGQVASDFEGQCRQVWKNIEHRLSAAGLGFEHLVKVTTFLSNRRHRDDNRRIRIETLGAHAPALTVIVTDLYDEAWFVEIEAIAAV
jgi:2-iminobutanoate/2-iminopropanoate deaminase